MKILVSISYYSPNISGLTIYAERIAQEMAKRGNEVTVLTSRFDKKLSYKSVENNVFVKRVWTPFVFGRGPIMPTYPFEALAEVLKNDLIHIHIPQFEGFLLAITAKIFGKKVIVTHHCDLSGWPGLINQLAEKLTYLALLVTGSCADKIVVYTKDYANHSAFLKRFRDKLVFVLPPVKLEKAEKFKLQDKFKKVKYRIGFAGRIAREKGIDILLNAIPGLKMELGENFKIFIAGPGKEVVGGGYREELSSLVEKYRKYLAFLGPLNQGQMATFYKKIDVLALPSTEKLESFGFVQVEALLSGCPVVASDLPGVRMPVKLSGMGEILPVGQSDKLANKIVKVLKNKKVYLKSKSKIEKLFSYEDSIDRYGKLFRTR